MSDNGAAQPLRAVTHQGQRVITTELLAAVYDTDPNNIQVNYTRIHPEP